jgi:hypothetical protein
VEMTSSEKAASQSYIQLVACFTLAREDTEQTALKEFVKKSLNLHTPPISYFYDLTLQAYN